MENSNQPAFPREFDPQLFKSPNPNGGWNNEAIMKLFGGLTKREYFAAMALQGILSTVSGGVVIKHPVAKQIAHEAIIVADELLKQLEN